MGEILSWPPAVWTLRLAFVIVVGGAAWVLLLYSARFLRPKHVWRMLRGELPEFHKVGGTAKLLGQELALQGELTQGVGSLETRVELLERQMQEALSSIELTQRVILAPGGRNE
jgi:hypothetical protein